MPIPQALQKLPEPQFPQNMPFARRLATIQDEDTHTAILDLLGNMSYTDGQVADIFKDPEIVAAFHGQSPTAKTVGAWRERNGHTT